MQRSGWKGKRVWRVEKRCQGQGYVEVPRLDQTTQQQQYMDIALQSAERSYDNYLSKYQQGLVDILDLLTVQQQVYDLEATLAQIHFSLLTNRIDLGLALGLGVAS